ncbi:hypothetical protein QR685DRAFT_532042 [Neurospora intermedia]|uniref:Secreted protein n=1 Tax=Neurospora intermedia TaxID=5142 RepID=A0ABR3D5I4_NEUIN
MLLLLLLFLSQLLHLLQVALLFLLLLVQLVLQHLAELLDATPSRELLRRSFGRFLKSLPECGQSVFVASFFLSGQERNTSHLLGPQECRLSGSSTGRLSVWLRRPLAGLALTGHLIHCGCFVHRSLVSRIRSGRDRTIGNIGQSTDHRVSKLLRRRVVWWRRWMARSKVANI